MKELCNKLMKLNPDLPYGTDYSTIALALFLQEEGMSEGKSYGIVDFSHYLYRFYSDITKARENHYYKIVNELWHYQPADIYDYSKSVLKYVEENIGLVYVGNTSFSLVGCPQDIGMYMAVIQGVIQTLAAKFIGNEYKLYDSRISPSEVDNIRLFESDSRVFYRALETLNYCFITDESDLSRLCAVELSSKEGFDESNYLILSREYAEMYINGTMKIKKNGYPYINGRRLFQHIEISALKKIRENLEEK